ALGYEALRDLNSTGTGNGYGMTAAGHRAGAGIVEGNESVAVGAEALANATGSFSNVVALGYRAGMNMAAPANSVIAGAEALSGAAPATDDVDYNVAIGFQSMMHAGGGGAAHNVAVGHKS